MRKPLRTGSLTWRVKPPRLRSPIGPFTGEKLGAKPAFASEPGTVCDFGLFMEALQKGLARSADPNSLRPSEALAMAGAIVTLSDSEQH